MKNCIIVCIFIQIFFFSTTAIYPQESQDDENTNEVVIQSGHYQGGIDHIESISYSPEGTIRMLSFGTCKPGRN